MKKSGKIYRTAATVLASGLVWAGIGAIQNLHAEPEYVSPDYTPMDEAYPADFTTTTMANFAGPVTFDLTAEKNLRIGFMTNRQDKLNKHIIPMTIPKDKISLDDLQARKDKIKVTDQNKMELVSLQTQIDDANKIYGTMPGKAKVELNAVSGCLSQLYEADSQTKLMEADKYVRVNWKPAFDDMRDTAMSLAEKMNSIDTALTSLENTVPMLMPSPQ